jgi:hypothetical protein
VKRIKKAKDKASKKATTSNKKNPAGRENGNVKSKKRKTGINISMAGKIVAIYGHELYRGNDHEKCVSEWFRVRYGNGSREPVNALFVAEEAPGLGTDYILEHCMDSDEDIKKNGFITLVLFYTWYWLDYFFGEQSHNLAYNFEITKDPTSLRSRLKKQPYQPWLSMR